MAAAARGTVTRGKGRPKRTEAAEIDRAIREAALQVLFEHGEAATMQAIAQAAGLSRKSLYARHPNKEALFLDVIRHLLLNADALVYDTTGEAETRLLHYVQAAIATIARPESQALQHLLRLNHGYIGALKTEMFAASRKIFLAPLVALLAEAKAEGAFAINDVEATARATIQLIFAHGLRRDEDWAQRPAPAADSDYAAFLTRLLTRGLTPRIG